jgi:Flp pilus assembly protein TadB
MRFSMPMPRRSRHPLVRALSLLVGLAVVGVLMVFGLVVASVLLVGGALVFALRQWSRKRASMSPARRAHVPEVIEGDFVVLRQTRHATH